jgi:hypothetical protein
MWTYLLAIEEKKSWNSEWVEEPINKIKHYLQNPPLFVSFISKRPLILYLTVTEVVMGSVLDQHDETTKKERKKERKSNLLSK